MLLQVSQLPLRKSASLDDRSSGAIIPISWADNTSVKAIEGRVASHFQGSAEPKLHTSTLNLTHCTQRRKLAMSLLEDFLPEYGQLGSQINHSWCQTCLR